LRALLLVIDSLFGTLEGWSNGVQVWSIATGLNGSYEFYGAQVGSIDELHLGFSDNFIVDDIMSNESGRIFMFLISSQIDQI